MKKNITISILLFLLTVTVSMAQFSKGTWLVGGAVGLNSEQEKSSSGNTTVVNGTSTTLNINPNAGYFIFDNFAVGAGLNIYSSKFSPKGSNQTSSSTALAILPFARYYYQNFYGLVSFGVGPGNSKYTDMNNKTTTNKYTYTSFTVGVGYAFLLNEHVAIEPQAGFTTYTDKYSGSSSSYPGPYLRVAFQIYLPKK